MKSGIKYPVVLLLLAVLLADVQAILPPKYTGDVCKVKEDTYPSRLIIKYFKPVDKGLSVEIGDPTSTVLVVDYDVNHRPEAYWEYSTAGDLIEKYELAYNTYGLLETQRKSGASQVVQLYAEYVYANPKEAKSLKEKKLYDTERRLLYTDTYQYDKNKNISSLQHADANGKGLYSYVYFYDESDLKEREIRQNAAGEKLAETEYTYDDNGRKLTESTYDAQGKMTMHLVFGYNREGLLNSVTMSVPGGNMERYRMAYEYDTHGNWIRQTVCKGAGCIPTSILVRVIEY